ncbi:MAG: DAK2 domain-containing protein [Clostridia bacterium]|nr:DAK2 domain-containing protein [Clostridia bacterium]
MNTKTMDGIMFANMIRGGAATLSANRQLVNDLNVFPIPDGDTGDNMFMTIDSGVAALCNDEYPSLSTSASIAAQGMLLGARGNSGVILSRIFAGISRGLEGVEQADVTVLDKAFETGISEAYSAVSTPVEGTILTVYKDAVRFAGSNIKRDSSIESYFDNFLSELRRSLERTPELLDVLRRAGVVDSGGAGFIYIAEGMQSALKGEAFEQAGSGYIKQGQVDFSAFDENSVLEYGYCTEFLLRLQKAKTDPESFDLDVFRSYLNSVGDSVVVFREGSIVKAHVHTMKPGDILNYCQSFGEFLTTKIENMSLQHNESTGMKKLGNRTENPHKAYGIVSVAAGSGIKEVFTSLGCDVVVDGGQSMNPSAEDLISAFRRINADKILVYPNNGNIILTAQQAGALYKDAEIIIIPSKTIGEGYAAISMLETENKTVKEILDEQMEIISCVITGIVSRAVRDTTQDGMEIRRDDYIGFVNDEIKTVSDDRNGALLKLADSLDADFCGIMIVVCGESVTNEEADALYETLSAKYKMKDVIMIDGRQPIYDYILILE